MLFDFLHVSMMTGKEPFLISYGFMLSLLDMSRIVTKPTNGMCAQ